MTSEQTDNEEAKLAKKQEAFEQALKKHCKEPIKHDSEKNSQAGVLVSSEIAALCAPRLAKKMIDPFDLDPKKLKPAAYHLSLGEHYIKSKKAGLLSEKEPYLRIEPYQVAIVETEEQLNMPPDVIGRWNLSISKVYKGLLWVGGPQVDPGFSGHLYCPLYNLSTAPVTLVYQEPFATIDFVRTTEGMSVPFNQKRTKLSDYNTELESAPEQTLVEVKRLGRRVQVFETTMLTTIGIIIAALAIIAGSNVTGGNNPLSITTPATLWIVAGAVVTFVTGFLIGLVARRR